VWVARIGGEPWGSRGSGSDKCGFSIDASDQSPLGYSLLSFFVGKQQGLSSEILLITNKSDIVNQFAKNKTTRVHRPSYNKFDQ
jgi:hypothetical protein